MPVYKVLLIDCEEDRRYEILDSLNEIGCTDVDARKHIHQDEFEEGKYDLILVHLSNEPEGAQVEKGAWKANTGKVILFSGGLSQDFDDSSAAENSIYYAKSSYLENSGSLAECLKEVLS